MSARGAVRLMAAGLLLLASACPKPHPAVHEQRFAMSADALQRIAVMPFYPQPGAQQGTHLVDAEIGELVARTFAEELQRSGAAVIPPNDLVMAFASKGLPTLRLDPLRAAQIASSEFGATSVVVGEIYRWRERGGEAIGSTQPASVGYEVRLHAAPGGRRLWSSRFDETQRPLSADVRNVRRYPGGGTRWLSALELARWGASESVQALLAAQ